MTNSNETLRAAVDEIYRMAISGVSKDYADKLIASQRKEAQEQLLDELVAKADKEYSRAEIDNWTFSLGALTHKAYLTSSMEKKRKELS